jgi:hypothetical protein
MFANRKNALGFAGVIVVVAVIASVSAGFFLPLLETQDGPVVEETAEVTPPQSAPTEAATSWNDEEFADDWGNDATGSGAAQNSSRSNSNEIDEPSFGDFSPESTGSAGIASRGSSSSRSSSNRQVRSGAAPGAPSIRPPGNGTGAGSGQLSIE